MATVITNKGLALLAKLVHGQALEITCAKTGAGTVDASRLQEQTGVTTAKQTMTVKSFAYPQEGKCELVLSVTNDDVTSSYSIMQIGIFAMDPLEGEVLFSIWQADSGAGINIPSKTVLPGYNAEMNYYIKYDQADSVNVTVDPSNTVSQATMEAYVSSELSAAIQRLTFAPASHTTDKSNPHGVTAEQVGTVPAADIANLYVWNKYEETTMIRLGITTLVAGSYGSIKYAESVSFSNGEFSAVGNLSSITPSGATDSNLSKIKGKYIQTGFKWYYIPTDATFASGTTGSYPNVSSTITVSTAYKLPDFLGETIPSGYASSKASYEYPDGAKHTDGYWYKLQTKLGEKPYTYGTSDLTPGESTLETGKLYFVYE